MIRYTEEEKTFLREYIPGHHHRDTAEAFSRLFRNVTVDQIKSYASRNKILTGYNGSEGMGSWNKGESYHAGGKSIQTQFKKGNMPHNTLPIGSEHLETDGFIRVKIADPDIWEQKHRLIWQQANRPIEKDEIVVFLDGNRKNFDLSNLRCISRRIHSVINHLHLHYCDNETFNAVCLTAELYLTIAKAKKRKKEMKSPGEQ